MNLKRYNEKKAKKLIEVIRRGKEFAILATGFDAETGEKIPPVTQLINVELLKQQKVKLQDEMNAIDSILSDVKLLKKELTSGLK